MNEPTMSDYTTNEEYITKYDQEEIIEGIKMKILKETINFLEIQNMLYRLLRRFRFNISF